MSNASNENAKEARAISFIEVLSDGSFRINSEAVEYIETLPQPLSVIACAGAYRTGKSLFLNRGLLQVEPGRGFAVGSTTNACTKGLWIHTLPIQVARKTESLDGAKEYTSVLIIDTEGLGAFDANDSHDTKIFALALLLCSYFIYNSVGKIDEDAIGRLSLVCNVCKQVRASADANNDNNDDKEGGGKRRRTEQSTVDSNVTELAQFFPQFLWLLRDFSLLLEDSSGASITAKQYLETALADKTLRATAETDSSNGELRKSIDEKNRLRQMLRQLFTHRDCATLMRPCIDEAQLQQLDSLGDKALRPEFLKQLASLRKKVLCAAPHKLALGDRPISGRGLVQLARSYVDAFNRGAAPVIRDSWNLLVEVQCRDAVDDAITTFLTNLATQLQQCDETRDEFARLSRVQLDATVRLIAGGGEYDLQLLPQSLETLLQRSFTAAVQKYAALCGSSDNKNNDQFQRRLEVELESMCARVRICNARNIEKLVDAALDSIEKNVLEQSMGDNIHALDTALADPALLPLFTFKPLWRVYCNLVDDSLQRQIASAMQNATDDATMRNIVQRLSTKRLDRWAMRIEDHWLGVAKRLREFIAGANARVQSALQDAETRLEALREQYDNVQQQQRVSEAALLSEQKINAEQRGAFDVALKNREAELEAERTQRVAERVALEAEWDEFRARTESDAAKLQQLLTQSRAELASETLRRESTQTAVAALEQRCAQMSSQMDQMHDDAETLRQQLQAADQTVSRLRVCDTDLQQARAALARSAADYGQQLAQLERDSVASLAKIRATNERTRREQDERYSELQQQFDALQSTSAETRRTLEAQLATLTEKLVQVRHDAGIAAERASQELALVRERLQAAEQALLDAQEQHKRTLQERIAKHEAETKQLALTARDEAKRVAAERAEVQRQLNEALTDAACQRVRNEHLQSKLQDETSRGSELLQAKKDFERAALLNDKLRLENEKLLGQQRAHQHELQERERRIDQAQKKLQEQEREFSAERLRLRLRIEEENAQQAQQAYRKPLANTNGGEPSTASTPNTALTGAAVAAATAARKK